MMAACPSQAFRVLFPLTLLVLPGSTRAENQVGATVASGKPVSAQANFRRDADYTFVADKKSKVKRTAVAFPKAYGATVAPDGDTYFIDAPQNGKAGGRLISKKFRNGVFYATPEVHDVVFSPGSKYVSVLDDERREVAVLSVPEGKLVKKFSRAYLARFRSDTVFQYRTDCQIYEVDLAADATERPLGPKLCGGADASMDGKVWIVAQPSNHGRVLSLRNFTNLTHIDGTTGNTTSIPAGSSFHDPSVSPGGKRICFGNSGRLSCYDLEKRAADSLGYQDAARLDWEQDDQLMLGATRSEILVTNFEDRVTRKVSGLEGIRYWRFFPGGTRLYVYDKGSQVLDLDAGTSVEIYGKKTEVGGFVPVPGRVDRFMTGNEIGSQRVHYWIDVTTPPDAKTQSSTAKPSLAPNVKAQASSKPAAATAKKK